jgi:hypothetical protein
MWIYQNKIPFKNNYGLEEKTNNWKQNPQKQGAKTQTEGWIKVIWY